MSSYFVENSGSGFPQKVCAMGYISNLDRLGLSTVDCGVLKWGILFLLFLQYEVVL